MVSWGESSITSASGLDLKRPSSPIVVADPVQPQASEEELMTVETMTAFNIAAFRRAYEQWDVEILLNMYADNVEIVQIDRDNPPSLPKVRHGKESLKGMFE